MKNAGAKFSMLIILISSVLACLFRFSQLLNYTDAGTGLVNEKSNMSYGVYALLLLSVTASAVYSLTKRNMPDVFSDGVNKKMSAVSVFLAVSFFIDFVHQCFNCFEETQSTAYVEYNYIIPMGLSGAFALLCSFYFFVFAKTMLSHNCDFKNFTFIQFSPVMWAFAKMIVIMSRIVDVKEGVETACEFLFLISAIVFFFCFISAADAKRKGATKLLVFSACAAAVTGAVASAPRIMMLLSGNADKLHGALFTGLVYAAVGIFAAALLYDINKRREDY